MQLPCILNGDGDAKQKENGKQELAEYYSELNIDPVQVFLKERLRTETRGQVFLSTRSGVQDVYTARSSILNRFIVSQLERINAWTYLHGVVNPGLSPNKKGKFIVRPKDKGKKSAADEYDVLVRRHGPVPALKKGFPEIYADCMRLGSDGLVDRWKTMTQYEDPTRLPLQWGTLFDLPATYERDRRASPQPGQFRLVAFDLDGTLIHGLRYKYSWDLVYQHLGYEKAARTDLWSQFEESRLKDPRKYQQLYQQWCEACIGHFRHPDHQLTRVRLKKAAEDLRLVDGFYEVISVLKAANVKLALISGGIDTFLHDLIPNWRDIFDYVFINQFTFDRDGVVVSVEATKYDFEEKLTGVRDICQLEQLNIDDAVFVGDSRNDDHVIRQVGRVIGFWPSSEKLQEEADIVIGDRTRTLPHAMDLREILPHILPQ